MKLSVISPVYKGEKSINELVSRLNSVLQGQSMEYEIILVEDGCPNKTWQIIRELCKKNTRLKAVKLSRNFGQHYAISCGLEMAKGDWVVVMDCDLQDRPEEIPNLLQKASEGFDIVLAQRKNRTDGLLKRASSKLFYKLFGFLTGTEQDASIANFGIYHKKVIKAVLSMKDSIRYFPTLVQWVGFEKSKIEVIHDVRHEGPSSYTWAKLIKLAVKNIIAFSNKPLVFFVKLGIIVSMASFIIGLVQLYNYYTGKITVLGFTSIIITITFLSGLIILCLGIIGIYLGNIFNQVKHRPTYIIEESINLNE